MNRLVYNYITILVSIFIICGCNFSSEKEKTRGSKIKCKKNHEKFDFNTLKLNGIYVSKFDFRAFLKLHPKLDSINEGYYYYGKSYFLYDNELKEMITIGILDDKLFLNEKFNVNYNSLKSRFPCSFSNSSDTEYSFEKCKVSTLYDENFSKIDIYYKDKKILGVNYTIDEGKYNRK